MYFHNLHTLTKHTTTLAPFLGTKDIFVIGGAVRDILLGITTDPSDIDLTLAADPEILRQHIEKNNQKQEMSIFRTDKYGTMTLIHKSESEVTGPHLHREYEITPFRTEGTYTDVRHPDDITRSDNLIADSKRRDFTINSLYRYRATLPQTNGTSSHLVKGGLGRIGNPANLLQTLKNHPNLYLTNSHTLILQDHTTIEQLFKQGVFQPDHLENIIQKAYHIQSLTQTSSPLATEGSPDSIGDKGGLGGIGNPETNNFLSILIDPHHGLQDLLSRKIRTVGNPDDRFTEDALRILRGVRFPNILNQYIPESHLQNTGFLFEKETRASMLQHAHLVSNLAKERIHQELVKVFSANNPFGYIALLDELGLIETLFPALAKCKHNDQPTLYHPFDTYTHTLLTLHALQKLKKTESEVTGPRLPHNPTNVPPVKDLEKFEHSEGLSTLKNPLPFLAMLYHDVGKPDQYAYISEQKAKHPDDIDMSDYLHHTETGVDIAKHDFQQLGFSKKEIEEITRYIRRHHRPGEILASNEKNQTKKIRQLLSEGGLTRCLNLLDIAIADRSGQYNPLQPAAVQELYDMKDTLLQLHAEEGRFTMKELAIDGNTLMKELKIQAGPELGLLLRKAFDRVLGDVETRNTKKAILNHLKSLEV